GPWGDLLIQAVADGRVAPEVLDDKLLRILRLARRVGALASSAADGAAARSGAGPRLVGEDLLRRATAASFVLLSNVGQTLPLRMRDISRVAVIGPGARRPTIQGGGSAVVAPTTLSTPAGALCRRLAGVAEVDVADGCQIWLTVPEPSPESLRDPVTGEPGLHLEFLDTDGAVLRAEHRTSAALAWWDGVPDGIGWGENGSVSVRTLYRPAVTGPHLFGAAGVGHLTITVDGEIVADRPTVVPADPVEAMTRPGQVTAGVDLQAGQEVQVRLGFRPAPDGEGPLALRFGIAPATDDDAMIAEAVRAARSADIAVVVVGSADLTESEGFDRPGLALPGRQDELVRAVAAVCPATVVVVNSGMPVLLPWADDVAAVIQAWLPGQAMGEALADVLLGDAEPGGRLPVTLPAAEADCPVLHANPVDGVLEYGEGLLVGYRGYDAGGVVPRFPFGHGLGYTSWDYEEVHAVAGGRQPGGEVRLRVVVRNTGTRPGREIVQAYLAGPPGDPSRPVRVLAAFGSATAVPGEPAEVELVIPARAFERWDSGIGTWTRQPGPFTVQVGSSSRDLPLSLHLPPA
ncbi:MAG TPA: glycoside hydrolase family 3 C-terminal domain-containing protein, partial [Streptosporangiaceae bacterium]